jgi:ATP-dependent Clp protease ATP-binding subunit ClpC
VGKTELARTIAEFLFGKGEKRDRLVRLDMSEYSGAGAARRLLGSPGGEPSELIKRLREQPFTVVLLDEIEKADAEVFDLLLGVFDEGRLTDRYGRLTTFRSALIIMTSNLGADRMEPFGLSRSPASNYDVEAMSFFRPEFFNRIDAVVTFAPLSEATIRGIAIAELGRISQREGLAAFRLELRWSDEIVTMVCEAGYDARYGARPLQRAIETLVVTPLAKFLVRRGKLRDATVVVSRGSAGAVEFSVAV